MDWLAEGSYLDKYCSNYSVNVPSKFFGKYGSAHDKDQISQQLISLIDEYLENSQSTITVEQYQSLIEQLNDFHTDEQ